VADTHPLVTVLLPTFRRPEGLAAALDGIAAQSDPGVAWELVVVDNDDPPGAEGVFHSRFNKLTVPARLIREPQRGSAFARNRGVAEARGEILAMLDDDVSPGPAWLGRLIEPILAGRADATGGRVVLDSSVPRPRWFDEQGIGGYLTQLDLGSAERDLVSDEIVLTANAAFRAVLLRASGGFDPALGPRGRSQLVNDDTLVVRRVRAAGGRVRYVPGATVVHQLPAARLRRRYLLRRAYAQGRSDWILDRELLGARRFGGARVALGWLSKELARRRREGLGRSAVAFHAACDLVRTAGALRESVALAARGFDK
jgi:glucosyl-dolichyl phosphate glucuronosyltransferase